MGWQDDDVVAGASTPAWQRDETVSAPPSTAASTAAAVASNAFVPAGAATLLSGAAAAPVAGLAGLAAAFAKKMGITETEAGDVVRKVMEALTIDPKTAADKVVVGAVSAPFEKLASVADAAGAKVTDLANANKDVVNAALGPLNPLGLDIPAALGATTNAGIQALPMAAGKVAPKATGAASKALTDTAKTTMQSALKPGVRELETGKAGAAIETLLDEGVSVTRGGAETLQAKIDGLNSRIQTAIQNSPAVIDKQTVGYRLQGLIDKFQEQVTPLADVKAIQKVWDEFLATWPDNIPVETAQKLKQGTYRSLGDKRYGELGGAEIEAQKTLARGLKEEIARAVPEVRPLNAQESKLINALSLVERRVLRDANKNPGGLGWLTSNPVKFAAWMADRSPTFKSLVARMLNTTGEAVAGADALADPTAIAAMQAGAMSEKRRREVLQQVND